MDSSDEDDVHQCGRCKEVFRSIDEYFAHKKSKVCKKPKASAVSEPTLASTEEIAATVTADTSLSALDSEEQNQSDLSNRIEQEDTTTVEASKEFEKTEGQDHGEDTPLKSHGGTREDDKNVTGIACLGKPKCRPKRIKKETQKADANSAAKSDDVSGEPQRENVAEKVFSSDLPEDGGKRKRKRKPKFDALSGDEFSVDENDPDFSPKKLKTVSVEAHVTRRRRGRPPKAKMLKQPKLEPQDSPQKELSLSSVSLATQRKRRGRPPKELWTPPVEEQPTTVTVFACPLCTFTISCRDELDRHLRRQHKMSLHNCEFCKKSFADKYKLQKHILDGRCQHKAEARGGADEAYDAALFEDELDSDDDGDMTLEEEQEMARKRAEPLFKCYECDNLYSTYPEVRQHVDLRHSDDKRCCPAICELCGRWFGKKEKFWRHLTSTVHDDVPDEDLARIKLQTLHIKFNWKPPALRKPNQPVFQCDQCNKSFKYREAFNKHIKYLHPEDGQLLSYKFTCSSCNEQFNHRRTYLSHLRVEHGIKDGGPEDFRCPVCVKKFKQKAHKYRHIESLHTPVQIVPDEVVLCLESEGYQQEIASNADECDVVEPYKQEQDSHRTKPEDNEDEGFSEATRPVGGLNGGENDKNVGDESIALKLDEAGGEGDAGLREKDSDTVTTVQEPQSDSIVNRLKEAKKTAMPHVTTWLTCPICCEKVTSRSLLLKHMQLHRVWVLCTSKGIATEGVQGVYDALNLRMPNIPQGLTDRETGLKIEDVLVQKTTPDGMAVPQPEEHFGNTVTLNEELANSNSHPNGVSAVGAATPGQMQREAGLNTIDQSVVRDLVNQENKGGDRYSGGTDQLTVAMDRDVIYKTVQKIVQDIRIKQLLGGGRGEDQETAYDEAKKDDTHVCPFCVQVHKTLLECYEHVVNAHNMIAAFQCVHKSCRRVFGSVLDYERHTEVHRQAAFICRVCNVHFEAMLDAVSHKSSAHRTMNQSEVNRCELCNRTFASKDALSKHVAMDTHHHQCDQCGKVMKNASELRDHESTHRGVRPYLCDQCGAGFANKMHLSRHRRLHFTTPKCLQCDQCTATFAKREHLKRHMQTQHTDEKPFTCQYPGCDKAFKRKDKLQDHYRMHSNETPYQCPLCGKAYRYREALKYHEKTHSKENKHFCTMCEAGFPRPAALRAHLKEKHQILLKHAHSYPCPQCGNIFSRPERLKRHMEFRHSVTADWKFKCPVCGRGCAGKKSFKSHMLRKHSLEGTIEQLQNVDVTPLINLEKPRKKRSEAKVPKMEMAMVQELQPHPVQDPSQPMQHHQIVTVQPQPQQQQQQIQLRVDDSMSQSVTAIIQPQQAHQSFTLQAPPDPGSTIYLIPSALSEKDQLVQNVVGFPQLVMTPSGTIQAQPLQNAQIAPAQPQNQAVATAGIPSQIQNVTLTGTNTELSGQVAAPVHTVFMATNQTVQRPEVTSTPVNVQQVATSSPVVQQHSTFSTIAPYSGFVNSYEQF